MQVLEITLTALATALPAILTAIVVLELLGISRITQRLNSLIRSMESPEALDNSINTVIGAVKVETAAKPTKSARKDKTVVKEAVEEEELEDLEEEPAIVTSFDFDDIPDEPIDTSEEPVESGVEEEEPMVFDDTQFEEEDLGDFELEIEKDGTFELKESDEEDEE